MFINENVIAVIFRFLNFISIIVLASFLFKKYILPSIIERITKDKEDRDSLFIQQANLEKKQATLDSLLKEDALKCEQFRSKIDIWKKTVLDKFAAKKHERDLYLDILSEKKNQNALHIEHIRVQNHILTKAIPHIEQTLTEYFKNEHATINYLDSIVLFMDEKNNEQTDRY